VFAAIAEFDRNVIRERTRLGLAAARARGRLGGRPRALTPGKIAQAQAMRTQKLTMPAIAGALGVSVATLYRHLDLAGQDNALGDDRHVARAWTFGGASSSNGASLEGAWLCFWRWLSGKVRRHNLGASDVQ
jgi:DNA invertase Pin-like site-specific DNA recombinase